MKALYGVALRSRLIACVLLLASSVVFVPVASAVDAPGNIRIEDSLLKWDSVTKAYVGCLETLRFELMIRYKERLLRSR
ncbi:MAG: hypothetical protein AB8B79_14785 [Granulosicoccus sp.]